MLLKKFEILWTCSVMFKKIVFSKTPFGFSIGIGILEQKYLNRCLDDKVKKEKSEKVERNSEKVKKRQILNSVLKKVNSKNIGIDYWNRIGIEFVAKQALKSNMTP